MAPVRLGSLAPVGAGLIWLLAIGAQTGHRSWVRLVGRAQRVQRFERFNWPMSSRALTRLRKLCLALPDASEKIAWGEPTFRTRKVFAMFASASNHHGAGRDAVWIFAAPGRQDRMVKSAPTRFFVPPYVGVSGWIGVWLDDVCDWDELADILKSAHALASAKPAARKRA